MQTQHDHDPADGFTRPEEFAVQFLEAQYDSRALKQAYARYLGELLSSPLWSTPEPEGLRIPWRSAKEAAKHPHLAEAFKLPGLYLFGSGAGQPLYLGKTAKQTLWTRLRGRYVSGTRSQCQLAADYEVALINGGIDGFPEEVRTWYRRNFGSSTVRLKGAVAFAEHGIEGIWFTILPIENCDFVGGLEQALIPVADAWNQAQGYSRLLNLHYSST